MAPCFVDAFSPPVLNIIPVTLEDSYKGLPFRMTVTLQGHPHLSFAIIFNSSKLAVAAG
jgi:hypothetical protein